MTWLKHFSLWFLQWKFYVLHCLSLGIILVKWSIVFNYSKGWDDHNSPPKFTQCRQLGTTLKVIKNMKNKILKTIYFVDSSLFNLLLVGAFTVHLSCLLDSICLQWDPVWELIFFYMLRSILFWTGLASLKWFPTVTQWPKWQLTFAFH